MVPGHVQRPSQNPEIAGWSVRLCAPLGHGGPLATLMARPGRKVEPAHAVCRHGAVPDGLNRA